MGTSAINKKGGLVIDFDKDFYYPGDIVNGKLYLDIHTDIEAFALELNLKIVEAIFLDIGYENNDINNNNKLLIDNNKHISQSDKVLVYPKKEYNCRNEAKLTLYQNTWVLAKYSDNLLLTGQYVYPFSFSLPKDLPGSFEYFDNFNKAYIKYCVTSRIISINDHENELSSCNLLIVRQTIDDFGYILNNSITTIPKSCCCISQGKATVNVRLSNTIYKADEELSLICEFINSKCKLDALSINMELFQRLAFINHEKKCKSILRKISEKSFEGLYVKLIYLINIYY
jgi:hypothetical protein